MWVRGRGGKWEKVRQSQEGEKDRLMEYGVSDLEIDRRTVCGEGGEQDQAAATTVGVQQRSSEHSAEAEEGRAAKRKPFSTPSGPQTKAKYSSLPVGTNTSGSVNETFSMIEEVVALNPQSNVLEDSGHVWFVPWESCQAKAAARGVRFRTPGLGWRCLSMAPMRGCEPNSPSVSNVLINQLARASLPKVVHPAQSISEKEQDHEAIKELAFVPVHNTEEINSEVIWEWMQKLHHDLVSLSEPTSTKHIALANKLVMENKLLKDGQIVLLQQVKDQKQMIDELSKQNRVGCLKEETAQLIKDKEELQRRLSRANELVKLLTDVLGATEASKDGMNGRG